MIHRIYSSLSSFKQLKFHPGLNVLIAEKEAGSSDRQTRNRAGKTSLIEIVHFLMGAKAEKDSPFRSDALANKSFGITFDLHGKVATAERRGKEPSKIHVSGDYVSGGKSRIINSE